MVPVWFVAAFAAQIQDVSHLLEGPMALAYIDETSFSKKGAASAGVARQYNGRLGKVDN